MRMKKLTAFLVTMSISISLLSGCGASNTNTSEGEVSQNTTTSSSNEGVTTLRWAVWDISSTTYYEPLINAYEEKNPNVKIEMVDLGSQDYMTALATQLSGSDTNLDVVLVKDIPGYSNLVAKNTLEPVNTENLDLSAYGGITEQILINDEIYALPFRSDFWVIFYNKDIFDAAGVEYPTNDMTFEEYDTLAQKVTKTDLGNEVYGAHYHTWRSAIQLFGILDGKNSIIDGNYDFLKPYYEMVLNQQNNEVCQDYATIKTSGLHYSGAFAQGNVAMMNMGSWFIPTLIEKISTGEYTDVSNWGIVKYPHAEGVEPGSTLATITSLAVTSASKNKEVATDFMNFVCGAEGAEVIAQTGTFPAIKTDTVLDVIANQEGFPADENSKEALKTSNTYLEMPVCKQNAEIEVILNDGHDYIMTGTKTIDEGIAYMNQEVEKILNNN